jgi:hypothetical protein
MKREYGADYPSGAKTEAALATVSGKFAVHTTGLRAGKGTESARAASQETCRDTDQQTERGVSEGFGPALAGPVAAVSASGSTGMTSSSLRLFADH